MVIHVKTSLVVVSKAGKHHTLLITAQFSWARREGNRSVPLLTSCKSSSSSLLTHGVEILKDLRLNFAASFFCYGIGNKLFF